MIHILNGLKGLLTSRKGTLSLIIFVGSLVALFMSKMDGVSFAAVMGTVQLIFCWSHSKTDQQSIISGGLGGLGGLKNNLGILSKITDGIENNIKPVNNKINQ